MSASPEARRLIGAVVMAAHGSDEDAKDDAGLALFNFGRALGGELSEVERHRAALANTAEDYGNRRSAIQSALDYFAALEARKAAA